MLKRVHKFFCAESRRLECVVSSTIFLFLLHTYTDPNPNQGRICAIFEISCGIKYSQIIF